jgi:hypothetical protein
LTYRSVDYEEISRIISVPIELLLRLDGATAVDRAEAVDSPEIRRISVGVPRCGKCCSGYRPSILLTWRASPGEKSVSRPKRRLRALDFFSKR